MRTLVGEYGFHVLALVLENSGHAPHTIAQELAENEQRKLLAADNHTSQPIAYQWPGILCEKGINFDELQDSVGRELEHAYVLMSPVGEWKTPTKERGAAGHRGSKRKASVSDDTCVIRAANHLMSPISCLF